MAEVGDRVEVTTSKGAARLGTVTAVSGAMVTMRWDTGGETSLIPGPGVLSIVRRARRGAVAGKPTGSKKQSSASNSASKADAKKSRSAAKTSRVDVEKTTKSAGTKKQRSAEKKATPTTKAILKKATPKKSR